MGFMSGTSVGLSSLSVSSVSVSKFSSSILTAANPPRKNDTTDPLAMSVSVGADFGDPFLSKERLVRSDSVATEALRGADKEDIVLLVEETDNHRL